MTRAAGVHLSKKKMSLEQKYKRVSHYTILSQLKISELRGWFIHTKKPIDIVKTTALTKYCICTCNCRCTFRSQIMTIFYTQASVFEHW